MTSEGVLQIFNPKRIHLKRSFSATEVNILPNLAALNLRDTKSLTGNMEDITVKRKEDLIEGIETRDLYSNDTILVNRDALLYKGKNYSINDIAFCWKKDCRMWLWKNSGDIRRNRSVGDHIKAKFIQI